MTVDRSLVQAILAVVIVVGALILIGFGRDRGIPTEVLTGLLGAVVGYYFGWATPTSGGKT